MWSVYCPIVLLGSVLLVVSVLLGYCWVWTVGSVGFWCCFFASACVVVGVCWYCFCLSGHSWDWSEGLFVQLKANL